MQNYQTNTKEQPRQLIRSMIIPQPNSQNKPNSIETFYYNVRRMNTLSSSSQAYIQAHSYENQNYLSTYPKEKNYQTIRTPLSANKDLTVVELIEKIDRLNKIVDKHQQKLSQVYKNDQQQSLRNNDVIIQQTINQLKKPNIIKQIFNASGLSHAYNAQIYEHIFNIKMDIQSLKQQIVKIPKKKDLDTQLNLSEQRIKQQINHNNLQYKKILKDLDDKIQKKTRSQNITLKSSMIGVNNNYQPDILLSKLQEDINQIKSQMKLQFKISPIRCTLPPIMLKYQEVFRIKQHSNIIINQNLYYVDNEGNLLDFQNRYILDLKGNNIKLEDKHLNMLKAVNIIK